MTLLKLHEGKQFVAHEDDAPVDVSGRMEQGPQSPNNRYPFVTRSEVKARMGSDRGFLRQCVEIMVSRHARRIAGEPGITGWGSSDASRVEGPAGRVLDASADESDWETIQRLLPRYARPVAQALREEQLALRPDLNAVARLFGVASDDSPPASGDAIEVAILRFLVEHREARTGEIVAAVDADRETITDRLRDMMARGTLARTGHGAGTTYSLLTGSPGE